MGRVEQSISPSFDFGIAWDAKTLVQMLVIIQLDSFHNTFMSLSFLEDISTMDEVLINERKS